MADQRIAPPWHWARWALACYCLLLVVATHWPRVRLPNIGQLHTDKVVHFGAYAVLAALGLMALIDWRKESAASIRWALAVWFAVTAFGLTDEATQPFMARTFDWFDWLADLSGAAFGLVLVALFAHLWYGRQSQAVARAREPAP